MVYCYNIFFHQFLSFTSLQLNKLSEAQKTNLLKKERKSCLVERIENSVSFSIGFAFLNEWTQPNPLGERNGLD